MPDIKEIVRKIGRAGISLEESTEGYQKWADKYEEDMSGAGYNGPALTARYLCESVPEDVRGSVKIMDVGAGTGFVGKLLIEAGFRHIDALDGSSSMLEEARKRNYYENYFVEFISKEPLNIPPDTYDGLTASGWYGEGAHFPVDALHEMIRLVKPGGYIVLVTRSTMIDTPGQGANKDLEPLMDELESKGKWRKVCRDVGKDKFYADYDAVVWKFHVL